MLNAISIQDFVAEMRHANKIWLIWYYTYSTVIPSKEIVTMNLR